MTFAQVEAFCPAPSRLASCAVSEPAVREIGSVSRFPGVDFQVVMGNTNAATALEVAEVYKEAQEDDWDGYGALALSRDTYRQALGFGSSLPSSFPMPEVAAEADGDICFDWYDSPDRMLSISINATGELNYSGIFGNNKARGTEQFEGGLSSILLALLRRVYSND